MIPVIPGTQMGDIIRAYASMAGVELEDDEIIDTKKVASMQKPEDHKFKTAVCNYCGTRKKWNNLVKAVTHPDAKKAYVCADYGWCDRKVERVTCKQS